jgi:hypothetical protein
MNIIEAMQKVKEGKRIKRKYRMHYIYYDGNDNDNTHDIAFGQSLTEDSQRKRESVFKSRKSLTDYLNDWKNTLKLDDYLANDWEVVE